MIEVKFLARVPPSSFSNFSRCLYQFFKMLVSIFKLKKGTSAERFFTLLIFQVCQENCSQGSSVKQIFVFKIKYGIVRRDFFTFPIFQVSQGPSVMQIWFSRFTLNNYNTNAITIVVH